MSGKYAFGQKVKVLRSDGSWSPGTIVAINVPSVTVKTEDGGEKLIPAEQGDRVIRQLAADLFGCAPPQAANWPPIAPPGATPDSLVDPGLVAPLVKSTSGSAGESQIACCDPLSRMAAVEHAAEMAKGKIDDAVEKVDKLKEKAVKYAEQKKHVDEIQQLEGTIEVLKKRVDTIAGKYLKIKKDDTDSKDLMASISELKKQVVGDDYKNMTQNLDTKKWTRNMADLLTLPWTKHEHVSHDDATKIQAEIAIALEKVEHAVKAISELVDIVDQYDTNAGLIKQDMVDKAAKDKKIEEDYWRRKVAGLQGSIEDLEEQVGTQDTQIRKDDKEIKDLKRTIKDKDEKVAELNKIINKAHEEIENGEKIKEENNEWARELLADEKKRKRICEEQFLSVDVNRNGTLDQQEVLQLVAEICGRSGLQMPKNERCAELFAHCDKSNDGKLQFKEFQTFFHQVLKSAVKHGEGTLPEGTGLEDREAAEARAALKIWQS